MSKQKRKCNNPRGRPRKPCDDLLEEALRLMWREAKQRQKRHRELLEAASSLSF